MVHTALLDLCCLCHCVGFLLSLQSSDGVKELIKDARLRVIVTVRGILSSEISCAVERSLNWTQNLQKSPLAREREPKIRDPLEPLARSRTFPNDPSESRASPLA